MSGILQVVDAEGEFNNPGVSELVKAAGVEGAGVAYTVVAIMGPQSSGKSTLLNHLVSWPHAAQPGCQAATPAPSATRAASPRPCRCCCCPPRDAAGSDSAGASSPAVRHPL